MTTPSSEDKTLAEAMRMVRELVNGRGSVDQTKRYLALESFLRTALAASGSKVDWAALKPSTGVNYAQGLWSRRNWEALVADQLAAAPAEQSAAMPEGQMPVTDEMVSRFLGWRLPDDFGPDCGISFDGRKDDEWNKNKTWPTGTNLLTAHQARAMLEHVLACWRQVAWLHSVVQGDDNEPDQALSFAQDNFPLMGDEPHLFRSVGCVPLYAPAAVQTKGKDDSPSGETYDDLFNALQRINTAACMLPNFEVRHEGGIDAFVQNIIDAIATPQTAAPAAQPEPVWPSDREWIIREGDLLHLMSVKIGAAYVTVEDAAKRTNIAVRRLTAAPPPAAQSDEARDAARYRWLRDVSVPPHNFYISVPIEFDGVRYTPDEVDAAIDAALAQKGTDHG